MGKFIDITGQRFGKLIATSHEGLDKFNNALWRCKCDCGGDKVVTGTRLRNGRVKSCGCIQKEITRERQTKHGLYHQNKNLFDIWSNMRQRCSNPNNKSYPNYGGRGISVCERWDEPNSGFKNFYEDMAPRPSKEYSLDRVDNNGNYCLENCRWANRATQSRNTRKTRNVTSEYRGVSWHKASNGWTAQIKDKGYVKYLGSFKDELSAAKVYDQAARELGYEEAWLNFPNEGI